VTLERKIDFMGESWNKRDPDPSKDYGVGAIKCRFSLIGERGAISFTISTGWYLPEVFDDWKQKGMATEPKSLAMGMGVHIHAKKEWAQDYMQDMGENECDLLPEGKCFSDVSFLAGDTLFDLLIRKGEEAVWTELESWYEDRFVKDRDDD
jgi:hypothetical protein